jgi:hypothetical protein
MAMTNSSDRLPISELEAMLPWYAAGNLDPRETQEVESALAADPELARRLAMVEEEMTEAILLNEALGAPSARVMDNLFKAIDKERKAVRRDSREGGLSGWLAALFPQRAYAFAAAAAVVVILLQAGVITKMLLDGGGGGLFETASAPTYGTELGSYALVRFAPEANIGEITRFLDMRGAAIVDGPRPGGAGGMYKVRVATTALPKAELDRIVKEFQSSGNLVSFAAPTE